MNGEKKKKAVSNKTLAMLAERIIKPELLLDYSYCLETRPYLFPEILWRKYLVSE